MNKRLDKKKSKVSFSIKAVLIICFLILCIVFTLMLINKEVPYFYNELEAYGTEFNLDQTVKELIAYKIPAEMKVGNNYKAIVTITKADNDSILFLSLDDKGFITDTIKASSRVKVTLLDPTKNINFDINSLNTEEQIVDDSTNTIWNWNIRPITSGENELVLRATVRMLNKFGDDYKDIIVFDRKIKVKSSFITNVKNFASSYWQWLFTVCIIPLILWGYKKLTEKRKIKKNNPIGFNRDKEY